MTLNDLLEIAIQRGASDLHLVPTYYPSIRINGELIQLRTMAKLTNELTKEFIISTLTQEEKESFLINKEIDYGTSYQSNNITYRFRVNAYFSFKGISASFRLIPSSILSVEQLKLPEILKSVFTLNQGLILITGPTGSGKSTTLASIIQDFNEQTAKHILTIEDPIEYIFPEGRSVVSQREIGKNTHNWGQALKSALREDPDIVLIGEMRDFETIQSAITIAETGHLVFSTLHTNSASQTIDRIIDVFPPHQQNQIRTQLSASLRMVFCQRLILNKEGNARVPAYEILVVNSAVSNIIREGKTHLIDNVIQTSSKEHMILFEHSLAKLYQQGLITRKQAISSALRPNEIIKLI